MTNNEKMISLLEKAYSEGLEKGKNESSSDTPIPVSLKEMGTLIRNKTYKEGKIYTVEI